MDLELHLSINAVVALTVAWCFAATLLAIWLSVKESEQ